MAVKQQLQLHYQGGEEMQQPIIITAVPVVFVDGVVDSDRVCRVVFVVDHR
jgi:hypothetical protein